jgi:bacterioferritin-associated ferredoxin
MKKLLALVCSITLVAASLTVSAQTKEMETKLGKGSCCGTCPGSAKKSEEKKTASKSKKPAKASKAPKSAKKKTAVRA